MRKMMFARGLMGLGLVFSTLVGCGGDDEALNIAAGSAGGPVAWTKVLAGDDEQMGWFVASTNSGQIVVAGTMQSRIDFGPAGQVDSVSDSDIFLAWIDSTGKIIRVRRFGETGGHVPTGIAVDDDGGVLLSGVMIGTINFGGGMLDSQTTGDAFLASFNANGEYRFALTAGGAGEQTGGRIAIAPNGNILWSGTYEGDINVGGVALKSKGQSDLFLANVDKVGKVAWAKSFGGAGYEGSASITIQPQGQILMSGFYEGAPDFGTGQLPDTGMVDGQFLAAFDAAGKLSWSRGLTHEAGYFPFAVHVDHQGLPWLIGACSGDVDVFGMKLSTPTQGIAMVQLDVDGQPMSSQVFAADEVGYVDAMHVKGGGFVIAGDFTNKLQVAGQTLTSAGESDLFVIWMDSTGKVIRQTRAGGAGEERFGSISMLPTGQVVVTGAFDGTMSTGGASYVSKNGPDGYVMLMN